MILKEGFFSFRFSFCFKIAWYCIGFYCLGLRFGDFCCILCVCVSGLV